uniref:site-specific DNA-methyltransferase (adenine-specific) n=1 Tax=uncultured Elusimicrobia bacterium TaxID=699876 RepID=A0A650EP79_9BACT|nr:hypothetical protein Elusimicrob1349_1640 [uncultured Elusimicrobia bacterium]
MNIALLHKTRRILAAEHLPADKERAFLMRAFALAWAQKTAKPGAVPAQQALQMFLPADIPHLSAATHTKIQTLLANTPAGQEGDNNAFTPEILALLQESASVKASTKGVFYTPWHTAQKLAHETLEGWSSCHKNPADILTLTACDPAAGAGGLLIPLWLELSARARHASPALKPETALTACAARLYAGDSDSGALQTLRLRAALTFYAQTGQTPPHTLFSNLLAGDALAGEKESVWQKKFPHIFSAGGFDVFICNPPYIGQKNNKTLFEKLRQNPRWQPYVTPKGDLLYLFFHLALELLKPGGTGGFLTTAYFAQAASAGGLRARLKAETAFLRLIDFNTARLFSRAPGQHNLISVFQKTPDKTHPCRMGEEKTPALIPQSALYSGPGHFLTLHPPDAQTNAILRKMDDFPLRLKDVAHISNGLMTGCDKISAAHLARHNLPGVPKGTGVFVLSQAEKDALKLSSAEKAKLKPFFKNSDILPFSARTVPHYWLIDFFYPNDRNTLFANYPRLTAHLARFKPVLLARKQNNNGIDKQLKKGAYWFGSVRRKMNFDAEKLAAPQRARVNTFAYTPGPWYASSDVYFVSAPKPGFNLWYLLALLNSSPYYMWLFYKGKRKGNLLELYSGPLAELPIPSATPKQQEELELLAKKIYYLKSAHFHADTGQLEQQINRLTGALFGLTEEEYALTEKIRKQAFTKN